MISMIKLIDLFLIQALKRINKDMLRLFKQLMKYPKDKIMQEQLALTGIKQLELQMEKVKIKKKAVQIESLVNKGYWLHILINSIEIFLSIYGK